MAAMKHTYHKLSLNCLVILGGNGTHKTSEPAPGGGTECDHAPEDDRQRSVGTDVTFGFQSAVDIATDTIDRIHTTATSHSRVFIIEVMGHKVGHVTLHAGIAGGADVILIPEIPYDIDVIANVIQKRTQAGKTFTILAVAEGADLQGRRETEKRKNIKRNSQNANTRPLPMNWRNRSRKKTDKEVRITVPGHTQRGGSPCPYDRILVQSRRKKLRR